MVRGADAQRAPARNGRGPALQSARAALVLAAAARRRVRRRRALPRHRHRLLQELGEPDPARRPRGVPPRGRDDAARAAAVPAAGAAAPVPARQEAGPAAPGVGRPAVYRAAGTAGGGQGIFPARAPTRRRLVAGSGAGGGQDGGWGEGVGDAGGAEGPVRVGGDGVRVVVRGGVCGDAGGEGAGC